MSLARATQNREKVGESTNAAFLKLNVVKNMRHVYDFF